MLIADTHVHAYPGYAMDVWWSSAFTHLRALAPSGVSAELGLLLTERHDCSFFADLVARRAELPAGYTWEPGPEPGAVAVRRTADPSARLWLFAGRQVVTREGVEVLALLTPDLFPDRHPADETVAAIRRSGGLPVLPWSPGKWLGRRGAVVRGLIEAASSAPLALGDTTLRPYGLPASPLIRLGRRRALPVLAGSDPLPFPEDAASVGRYAVRVAAFDPACPVLSLRAALAARLFSITGRRDAPPRMLRRWLANQRARKGGAA